ncbi:uncharacterized protein [Dermacentor andersoni]|uniref:uncharacterized protein isoform X3 n=1 Tax=Dermacentor andersoni TaxID=34620 RepID=UPI002415B5D4|nr:uncharacterized protein LOC129380621 isoform X3 [Dermacentor andersoni]
MSNVVSSPLSTTAIFSVPDVAKWRKGAMQNQEMTPAEAVLAGAILFPEDEVPWYERTISLPKQFEGVTPVPQADVDEPSISGPSYVVYAFFSGFLVLLVLIAIIAYIISYIASDTIGDWLALKQTSRLKLLVGLRFQATAQFTTATDQRITQLVQTLRDHYNAPSGWDGVVISRTGADAAKEIVLYEALHKDIAKSNFQIIAHVLPASIQFYNFPLMHRYVDFIVVETHDFIVQGKAYPPCMYEAGGTIDASGKNLVDVLNAIQNVDRQVMNKLVPTVSTVGKKYDFLDALATKPGDPVFRTIPEDEPLVDLCRKLHESGTPWKLKFENNTKCDAATDGSLGWIGFESARSVKLKTELVKKKRLAGIAVLNIEQDDRFACTSDNHPFLLGAVYSELRLHSS